MLICAAPSCLLCVTWFAPHNHHNSSALLILLCPTLIPAGGMLSFAFEWHYDSSAYRAIWFGAQIVVMIGLWLVLVIVCVALHRRLEAFLKSQAQLTVALRLSSALVANAAREAAQAQAQQIAVLPSPSAATAAGAAASNAAPPLTSGTVTPLTLELPAFGAAPSHHTCNDS
jgi:hypothetical protein